MFKHFIIFYNVTSDQIMVNNDAWVSKDLKFIHIEVVDEKDIEATLNSILEEGYCIRHTLKCNY